PDLSLSLRYGVIENNISKGRTPTHRHALSMQGGDGPSFSYSSNVGYRYQGPWQPGLFSQSYSVSVGMVHVRDALTLSGSYSYVGGGNGTVGSGIDNPLERYLYTSGEWARGSINPAYFDT